MSLTEEQVKQKIDSHNEFIEYVNTVFDNYIVAEDGTSHLSEESIYFDDDTVYGEGDEHWSYGGHEHYTYNMPISMLWQEDLAAAMAEERRQKDAAKKAAALVEQARMKAYNDEQERQQYQRLHRKYGGK